MASSILAITSGVSFGKTSKHFKLDSNCESLVAPAMSVEMLGFASDYEGAYRQATNRPKYAAAIKRERESY